MASVLVTSKFSNDVFYANNHIAMIGGVSPAELNLLERYFLDLTNWHVNVHDEEYLRYLNRLIAAE